VTRKEFKFAAKHNLPLFYVSAADGTNIVKVRNYFPFKNFTILHALNGNNLLSCSQVFQSAIAEAKRFKASGGDTLADMLDLLGAADKVNRVFTSVCCIIVHSVPGSNNCKNDYGVIYSPPSMPLSFPIYHFSPLPRRRLPIASKSHYEGQ